jgi:uroporphyrinogen decarboxylase
MTARPPLQNPRPDGREFIGILTGRIRSSRVPLVEYIVDDVVMEPVVTELLGRRWIPPAADRETRGAYLDNTIEFWYRMGYDFVRYEESLPLPDKRNAVPDTAPGSAKKREWTDEHHGVIESWEDFEKYPWPSVGDFDFSAYEYLNAQVPEGMGLIVSHGGGVFEHLSWMMSLEGLSLALYEAPDLVAAVANRLGELMTAFYTHILDLDRLIAVFPGDDMGYKSATMISPQHLRTHVLPWHRRFAAMAHERGVPYFLHSCGNVISIMEDLIEDVRIDGKHSYEDAIVPVQDFQARYGKRLAVLGGLDINILSGAPEEKVREHVRFLLKTCGGRGRYALGSGNSVPSYVPVRNYLAMIEETHKFSGRM